MKTSLALIWILSIGLVINTAAQCEGDCQNGYGKIKLEDGSVYEGNWKGGAMHGIGTLTLPDGNKYFGQLKENTLDGYGVFYNASGEAIQSGIYSANKLATSMDAAAVIKELEKKKQAVNQCTGNCQSAWGKFTFSDESYYEGQWKNAVFDGVGTYVLDGGDKYYGEFKAGGLHGYGVLYDRAGSVTASGRFDTNKLAESLAESKVLEILKPKFDGCTGDCTNGKGTYISASENMLYEGSWSNGKMHGYGNLKMTDVSYMGEFALGECSGYGIFYTSTGTYVQSGIYEKNILKTAKTEAEVKKYLAKYK
jgi:hypothetical protein